MRIGNIDLGEKAVLLATMEDVTDASFRILCREAGADMVYTEVISSDGLIRDARKTLAKIVCLCSPLDRQLVEFANNLRKF